MYRLVFSFLLLLSFTSNINAGFDRWTSEVKENPFTGGKDVSVLYNLGRNSQVQIRCDSSKNGITIIAIPGYEVPSNLIGQEVRVKFAVDGKVILEQITGLIGSYGQSLLGVDVNLTNSDAEILTAAFEKAQKQIAISDGVSSKPFLMSARGSTKSAQRVRQCYKAQNNLAEEPKSDDELSELSKAKKILEIEKQIKALKEKLELLNGS